MCLESRPWLAPGLLSVHPLCCVVHITPSLPGNVARPMRLVFLRFRVHCFRRSAAIPLAMGSRRGFLDSAGTESRHLWDHLGFS
jgi:hypothetical protein